MFPRTDKRKIISWICFHARIETKTTKLDLFPCTHGVLGLNAYTSYARDGFDDEKQAELARFIHETSRKGAFVLASNSDPKNTDKNDNFFDDLYHSLSISRISAGRAINSLGAGRGRVSESLIANFGGRRQMRAFAEWLSHFRESISDYAYVDFAKVYRNVEEMRVELNIMNTLVKCRKASY